MPTTKEGQKKLNSLELSITVMQTELKSLGDKIDDLAKKVDSFTSAVDEFKMVGHDNSRDISELKLDTAKICLQVEGLEKKTDKVSDNFGKVKSYIAGGVAVLGFILTIVMYVIDKFVK